MSAPQKTQEAHFDDVAEVYDEALPSHVTEHYLEKRVAYIRDRCPRGDALDVGCGTGILAGRLRDAGYRMTGVDPSEGMLDELRRNVPGVEPVKASATDMPFPDDTFDLVYTVAAMHHIADPEAVQASLREMVRVARPGGRILVWDHNPRNPYWPLIMSRVPQDQGDERLVSLDEITTGLEAGGATPIEVSQLGLVPDFVPPALLPLAVRAESLAERTPGVRVRCAHNVVLALKAD